MERAIGVAALLALLLPAPAWASGGHGSPTPTCRKGCKPLSPWQLRQLRYHPEQRPPSLNGEQGR